MGSRRTSRGNKLHKMVEFMRIKGTLENMKKPFYQIALSTENKTLKNSRGKEE